MAVLLTSDSWDAAYEFVMMCYRLDLSKKDCIYLKWDGDLRLDEYQHTE